MDAFYVALFGFEREGAVPKPRSASEPLRLRGREFTTPPPLALGLRNREGAEVARPISDVSTETGGPVYRADNFRLLFDLVEGPVERDTLRPLGVEVPSLAEAEAKVIEADLEYTRQRGVAPGHESLLLLDPAGNWVEVVETRGVG